MTKLQKKKNRSTKKKCDTLCRYPDNWHSTLAMTFDTLSQSTPWFDPKICCNLAVITVGTCPKVKRSTRKWRATGAFQSMSENSKLLAEKSQGLSKNWVILKPKSQGLSDADKLLVQNSKDLGDNDELQNVKLFAPRPKDLSENDVLL